MGGLDRALRAFVIAPVATFASFAMGVASIAGIVLLVLAGIALATGAIGRCPSYVLFGIDTRIHGRVRAPLPY
jgi:hypothetical protein